MKGKVYLFLIYAAKILFVSGLLNMLIIVLVSCLMLLITGNGQSPRWAELWFGITMLTFVFAFIFWAIPNLRRIKEVLFS